ncbi:MAG: NAD(+) synthase [Clostridiales bacterium]|nr:NAD(+) synthase [Clostridiales bacterium]
MSQHFGFYRVAAASPAVRVGNPQYNAGQIIEIARAASAQGNRVLVTPELSLCGYTCADLFFQDSLLEACEEALGLILEETARLELAIVVGMPLRVRSRLLNCAVVLYRGNILGAVPKEYVVNYNEFYEKRWFDNGRSLLCEKPCEVSLCAQQGIGVGRSLFRFGDLVMGVEICEDLWVTIPPSSLHALHGANLIVNLSASNELIAKREYRESLVVNQSARCIAAYVYAGAGVTESTTDLVFSGDCLIAQNGAVLAQGERFQRKNTWISACIDVQKLEAMRRMNTSFLDNRQAYWEKQSYLDVIDVNCAPDFPAAAQKLDVPVDPHPFVPAQEDDRAHRCEEILNLQSAGLATRLAHIGAEKCIVGISGGLDSTLALLVAVRAVRELGYGSEAVIGVTMPGFGTTDRTYGNACALMDALGVTRREIDIKAACLQHMKDIGHDPDVHDITYENTQARERTQILMDLANQQGAVLVGTGDLSELALGWCTYNGDHMSMYAVNSGVPKTLIRYVVETAAIQSDENTKRILMDVLDTPVSPELLPTDTAGNLVQKTEEQVGPYELHDFFLYHMLRYGASKEKIYFLACRAFMPRYPQAEIARWLDVFMKRFFASQFKRSCMPDGVKVGGISLSPRGDWRMPSDADVSAWLLS